MRFEEDEEGGRAGGIVISLCKGRSPPKGNERERIGGMATELRPGPLISYGVFASLIQTVPTPRFG